MPLRPPVPPQMVLQDCEWRPWKKTRSMMVLLRFPVVDEALLPFLLIVWFSFSLSFCSREAFRSLKITVRKFKIVVQIHQQKSPCLVTLLRSHVCCSGLMKDTFQANFVFKALSDPVQD